MPEVCYAITNEKDCRKTMITVKQLMGFLEEAEDKHLRIKTSNGEVPKHFHITEIGRVYKFFVDCGGKLREADYCSMQIWVANDVDHRITSKKLHGMFTKAKTVVPLKLPIMIEYGEDVISLYELDDILDWEGGLLFMIEPKQAECLAPEVCGVDVLENNCCSGDNCC